MKPFFRLTLLLCLLFAAPFANAQGTFTGDLTLTTQAQVDAFNYTEVTGDLEINGADITDLSPLSGLTTIGGMLNIWDNPLLQTIESFNSLSSVGETILIDSNDSLTTFTGFGALQTVGGAIYFYTNNSLVTVDAFHNLTSTGDNIDFWYNDSLETVAGFQNMTTVGWSLEFGGNPKLVEIPLFESLKTISSSLFIMENPMLPAITGFQNLEYVDYSFNILSNPVLDTLCGFYNYFSANNPYAGNGTYSVEDNHPSMPNPTTIQDIIDAGPCPDEPGEILPVPTIGQWGLWLMVLSLMVIAWRHRVIRARVRG